MLRCANRREDDYEAIEYINNRLNEAREKKLLNVSINEHPLSQKSQIAAIQKTADDVAAKFESVSGFKFDAYVIAPSISTEKIKEKKRSK